MSFQALEDEVTEITSAALSFIDSDSPSEKIIYNITKPLPPGQGLSLTHTSEHTLTDTERQDENVVSPLHI